MAESPATSEGLTVNPNLYLDLFLLQRQVRADSSIAKTVFKFPNNFSVKSYPERNFPVCSNWAMVGSIFSIVSLPDPNFQRHICSMWSAFRRIKNVRLCMQLNFSVLPLRTEKDYFGRKPKRRAVCFLKQNL